MKAMIGFALIHDDVCMILILEKQSKQKTSPIHRHFSYTFPLVRWSFFLETYHITQISHLVKMAWNLDILNTLQNQQIIAYK